MNNHAENIWCCCSYCCDGDIKLKLQKKQNYTPKTRLNYNHHTCFAFDIWQTANGYSSCVTGFVNLMSVQFLHVQCWSTTGRNQTKQKQKQVNVAPDCKESPENARKEKLIVVMTIMIQSQEQKPPTRTNKIFSR